MFQAMKFVNMRNIFLEKAYTRCGKENGPRSFSEKLKLSISLDQQFKVLYGSLLLYDEMKSYENILKRSCRPLAFNLDFLVKQEEVWNYSPSLIFCMIFEEKYFSQTDQISLSDCLYVL